MVLSASPTDDELLERVHAWIDALACGKYEAAFRLTKQDPYYKWSPDLIESVVAGYGLPHIVDRVAHKVTPREQATGGPPSVSIDRVTVPLGVVALVRHDLPLDGAWSDLTATFRVEPREREAVLVLEEIHVL